MSELRRDPTTDSWVIVAPERDGRPHSHRFERNERVPAVDPDCPFCPGNEAQLPSIIAQAPEGKAWRTRTVPNKFPAVTEGDGRASPASAFYRTAPGVGSHEVIIESPRHDADLATMTRDEVAAVIATYRDRYSALATTPGAESVVLFRNHGRVAGASLQHPHAQIIAIDRVPPLVEARRAAMVAYYSKHGRCVLCDVLAHEARDGVRLVKENDAFIALVPFAASAPFEVRIVPKRHQADFGELRMGEIPLLAESLRDALRRLDAVLHNPPYKFVVDTAPVREMGAPALHWCLRIAPQPTVPGGFELGSGLPINPSLPEDDAALLRAETPAFTSR